jgi:hypothetical protein
MQCCAAQRLAGRRAVVCRCELLFDDGEDKDGKRDGRWARGGGGMGGETE